jgi:hypothetical protein
LPIPDAPEPKKSNVYKQLSSEQLGSISKTNFDIVQDPVFIAQDNEDELRRINLVGAATSMKSFSGPIPGTGKIESISGSYSSGTYVDIFTPGAGEVWQIISADFNATLSSGTVDSVQLYVSASSTAVMIGENTGDNFDTFRDIFSGPITIDENMTVQARASSGNITALAVRLLLIRVR